MNDQTFQQARTAYANKDYESALGAFTACLQDPSAQLASGEVGLLYHRIGNCLMKLRDFDEAIHAYTQATADAAYDQVGAVNNNMGMCYAALHDYEDAVQHFEIAVSDRGYDKAFKAYEGMGNSYLKLGKYAEAGSAFRSGALDEANPNPAKALTNLGICFMALGRPADAVASYESALQFHMNADAKNKLFANLGQAYTANNQFQQAVNAFETALADKTYFLNDAASVDYQRAVGSVAQGTAVMDPVVAEESDMSGLDVSSDGVPIYHETDLDAAANDPYYYADNYDVRDNYASGDDRFFNATDEELEKWSRGVAKQDRRRRNVGLKVFIVIIVILLLLAGAAVFGYTQGYGYPMQDTVAKQLFANPEQSESLFSTDVSADTRATMLDPVVTDADASIDGIDRSMTTSLVYATCKTPEGGQIQYRVSMVRDGIGWKITNVELYFPSQNQE